MIIIGFIIGLVAGVMLAAWHNLYLEQKEFEEELNAVFDEMEEGSESFSYDCMTDTYKEEDSHIPKVN